METFTDSTPFLLDTSYRSNILGKEFLIHPLKIGEKIAPVFACGDRSDVCKVELYVPDHFPGLLLSRAFSYDTIV